MSYEVNAGVIGTLRLNETAPVVSVLQNIALILSTRQGSVPMYRDFGLPMDFVDKPIPVARVLMIAAVREAVEKWEPRATVLGVTFDASAEQEGRLVPIVEVDINLE